MYYIAENNTGRFTSAHVTFIVWKGVCLTGSLSSVKYVHSSYIRIRTEEVTQTRRQKLQKEVQSPTTKILWHVVSMRLVTSDLARCVLFHTPLYTVQHVEKPHKVIIHHTYLKFWLVAVRRDRTGIVTSSWMAGLSYKSGFQLFSTKGQIMYNKCNQYGLR